MIQLEFAKSRRRVDAKDRANPTMLAVEIKFGFEICIRDPVTIRDRKMLAGTEIFLGSSRNSGTGHRQCACTGQRDVPVILVLDLMNGDVIGLEANAEVAVHGGVIEKIILNDFRLVAKAQ